MLHFALQEKQQPFSASDHHEVGHRSISIEDSSARAELFARDNCEARSKNA